MKMLCKICKLRGLFQFLAQFWQPWDGPYLSGVLCWQLVHGANTLRTETDGTVQFSAAPVAQSIVEFVKHL